MYRVKQFIWAITSNFKKVDKNFLKKYLSEEEMKIFNKLKVSEQHHCVRVCTDAINMAKSKFSHINIDYKRLGKIALLHDVGKIEQPLNVIEKSVIVIVDKISKGKLNEYTKFKKVDSYYNHPKKSAKILAVLNYDREFLDTIRSHHNKLNGNENVYLNIIKTCDDLN